MANIDNKNFIQRLLGSTGDEFVIFKTSSGEPLRARKPAFDDSLAYNETGRMHQAAVRDAATYAGFAATQGFYIRKAQETGVTAYSLALTDWFGAPRVLEINVDAWTGKAGQILRVKARDNVVVARLVVVIRDERGKVLEVGEATPSGVGSAWWNYSTRSRQSMRPFPSVEAIAFDLPGNRASFTIS